MSREGAEIKDTVIKNLSGSTQDEERAALKNNNSLRKRDARSQKQ